MNPRHAPLLALAAILFFILSVSALLSMSWTALFLRAVVCAGFTLTAAMAARSKG
jgi:hypothetical protein